MSSVKQQRKMRAHGTTRSVAYNPNSRLLEPSDDWQKHTFRWWPAVMGEYNVSLSGRYTTFLPPVILTKTIAPHDPSLLPHPITDDGDEIESTEKTDLNWRVSWLEKQLMISLAMCAILMFTIVGGFLVYICAWDEWQKKKEERKSRAHTRDGIGSRGCRADTAFRNLGTLRVPITVCTIVSPSAIGSATVDGRLILWPTNQSKRPAEINRRRPDDGQLLPNAIKSSTRRIWALTARHSCMIVGCADGCIEIASCETLRILATLHSSSASVVQLVTRSAHLVIARVDGSIEFASLDLSTDTPCSVRSFITTRILRCSHGPLTHLLSAPLCFLAVGLDSVIKIAFSVCEAGVLCAWQLTGVLAWTTDCTTNVALAVCASYLISLSPDGRLVLREKRTGKKISELANQRQTKPATKIAISSVHGDLVVVSLDVSVAFWDLEKQALIGEVDMEFPVDTLHILSDSSILVASSNSLVIVDVPSTRFR